MKKRGRIKIRKIKTWKLLVILLPLLFIDATLLRVDHIKMTELRSAVLTADESDDDAKITESLNKLKDFAFSNIVINITDDNGKQKVEFGTGPFYLEHKYLRVANEALQRAENELSNDSNPNGNIYAAASNACKGQAIANGWAWNNEGYINCMMSEINKYPASDNLENEIKASLPSTELFRYNFASPIWAPTLSGFMILLTILIIVVIFIRLIIWIILRLSLLFI